MILKNSHIISFLAIGLLLFTPILGFGLYSISNSNTQSQSKPLLFPSANKLDEIDAINAIDINQKSFEVLEFHEEDPDEPEDPEDPEDPGDEGSDDGEDHDSDNDEVDDDLEESNERTIEVEYSEDEAAISSKLRSGDQIDEIKMKIQMEDDGLEVKVEYQKDTTISELEVEFELTFTSLIEFVDGDNNNIYNSENDTLLTTHPLTSFNDIQYTKTQINATATTFLHYFQISTSDNVLTFHIYFVEEFDLFNDLILIPTQTKIDIEIFDYNYLHNSSQLGLLINMDSETDYDESSQTEDEEEAFSSNEQWLKTTSNNISGFFSWNEQALIDGSMANITVDVNSAPGENEQQISIYYPRGIHIYHDPKIGISGILQAPSIIPPIGGFFTENLTLILIIGVASLVGVFGLIMSKQEYRHYLLNRVMHLEIGPHRLSMEEVLENDFRNIILNLIIDQPGIHYSELLRLVDTSSSNLAWHLDILENYKIILKKRVGRFLIFYPYLDKNPFAEFDPTIIKSKTTLDIFQIIGDNPGIIQSRIAKRMELNRKTIKYHLDKLESAGLIKIKKIGRKAQVYSLAPIDVVPGEMDLEFPN